MARLSHALRRLSPASIYRSANIFADASDRQGRRRPFATWVKKLTNFKNGGEGSRHASSKRNKKRVPKMNNPYPQSGYVGNGTVHLDHSRQSFSTAQTGVTGSATSLSGSESERASAGGMPPATAGARSTAPTMSTDYEAARSITAPSYGASSVAGTNRTRNGGVESRRGGDSTFSSPAPSVRSMTTTLTTIQSMAPNGAIQGQATASTNHHVHHNSLQAIHFNQPFPTTAPASAIPAHLAPSGSTPGHPTTYSTATANNLLTDNASILTLASSSKRRRRRSLDTDASVRAMAPSSLWGGSRESLPLSVLSANVDGVPPTTPGLQHTNSRIGERTSIYSTTGILAGERNSYFAKPGATGGGGAGAGGDGASVRSGLLGHGRADSVSGSIGGRASSLASPRKEVVPETNGIGGEDDDGEDGGAGAHKTDTQGEGEGRG